MIFTNSTYRKVSLYLIVAVSSVFLLLAVLGIVEYRESEYKLRQDLSSIFKQSIREQIKLQMTGEFVLIQNGRNQFSEKGAIKTQTVVTQDTTISKEAEVSGDFDIDFSKNSQTYLFLQKRLQPQELQHIFDSKLQENGVKKASVVLIGDNQHTQTGGDTAKLSAYYRLPVVKGGVYDEIFYEGFVSYSPLVVFQWMSKSRMLVLLFIEIGMLGVIAYLFIEKRKIKPDKIIKRGRYYYIGNAVFDTRKYELIGQNGERVTLTNKPAEVLLMFLQNDEHKVEKNVFKETLWPDNPITANQNLMSTINKLRNYLKDADCTFNVVTKKGDDYYDLKFMQNDTDEKIAGKLSIA